MRDQAVKLARAAGWAVEFIQRRNFRKESRGAAVLSRRGHHPGWVHVFSAMEPCPAFRPWHDKVRGRTGVKFTQGKCLHFYFYFVHERLGLCYLRGPTWLPFRLQFYFNGHAGLAHELRRAGIAFGMEDNAFVEIADWNAAQTRADGFSIQALPTDLDALARQYVPFLKQFPNGYHWSLMPVAYSWDLSWKRAADLAPIYAEISRQALLTVKAPDVAKFLGQRLSPAAELTSDFRTRLEGTRIKHSLGPASLKLSHYRKGEHRDEQHRGYRGFNFFATGDRAVSLALLRGEYHISGLSNRRLQRGPTGKNGGQLSRVLKRLRRHGLIKKIGHTYPYYLTALGQKVLVAALKLKEHLILPTLMTTPTPAGIS